MADEDLVFDLHAFTDEGVTLNLAICPHDGTPLDLDKRPDARVVADPAAVEIRERKDDDVSAELNVVQKPVRRLIGR